MTHCQFCGGPANVVIFAANWELPICRACVQLPVQVVAPPEAMIPRRSNAQPRNSQMRCNSNRRVLSSGDPCVYCGAQADTVDHVTPRSKGGGNEFSNLAPACRRCNTTRKSDSILFFLLARRENPQVSVQ